MDLLGNRTRRQWNLRTGRACGTGLDKQMAHPVRLRSFVITHSEAGLTLLPGEIPSHLCHMLSYCSHHSIPSSAEMMCREGL